MIRNHKYGFKTSKDHDTRSVGDIITRLRWKYRAKCSCGIFRMCLMHCTYGEKYHQELLLEKKK
jgi:hypothetical protein